MTLLSLHTIAPKQGSRRDPKRVGRGLGSKGTYSGRGVKGQKARSGGRAGLKLKGLRRIMLAIPKQRGFVGPSIKPSTVNVGELARIFSDGSTVNPKILKQKGLVSAGKPVKILGDGAVGVKLQIEGCKVSALAKQKIESAGGRIS